MKPRLVLFLLLLPATLIPLVAMGSPGCGSDTHHLENEVWTRQFGTRGLDYDYANAVIVDGLGNVYVAGNTTGTFPGQTSSGSSDAFIAKYDTSGNQVWTRQFGTPDGEWVLAMVADASGNIYLAGGTWATSTGETSFIAKYDPSGNEVWTRQIGADESVRAMVIDGSGNIYLAGNTIPPQTPTSSWTDAFIAKYDTSWNEVWTRHFGTYADDSVKAMVVDGSGNIYVAGDTMGTFSGQTSSGFDDAFVAKYDTSGNEAWTKQFGTPGADQAYAMAADGSGNICVAGNTAATASGDVLITSGGPFMAKYDTSGNDIWMRQLGTGSVGDLCAYAVIVDGLENIYVAGDTNGSSHASMAKYDTSGNEIWTRQFGTRAVHGVKAVVADGSGNIYLAGYDGFIMKIRE